MASLKVMLKQDWASVGFRRHVINEKGEPAELLHFLPGEVVELDETQAKAIADDIGMALFLVGDRGDGRMQIDFEATDKAVLEIARAKVNKAKRGKKNAVPNLKAHQIIALERAQKNLPLRGPIMDEPKKEEQAEPQAQA